MKPFLLLSTRPEDAAADGELAAFRHFGGLGVNDLERIRLEAHERTSPTWLRLSKLMNARLAELRAQNDAHLPTERTADLRGRIAMLKELLSLGDEPRKPTD